MKQIYISARIMQDAGGRAGSGGRRRIGAEKFQARLEVWSRQSVDRLLETTQ